MSERPPIKIDGKRNPEYDKWYREQKKAATNGDERSDGPSDDGVPAGIQDPPAVDEVAVEAAEEAAPVSLLDLAKGDPKSGTTFTEFHVEHDPEAAAEIEQFAHAFLPPVEIDLTKVGEELEAELDKLEEVFQSAAEPEQTTNDDPREPEVAPALEALSAESNEPQILSLFAIKEARNDRYVLCAHPTEKGKMVPVRLHKKIGGRLIKKPIDVRVEGEGEEAKYFHVR